MQRGEPNLTSSSLISFETCLRLVTLRAMLHCDQIRLFTVPIGVIKEIPPWD
ncbi:hypothetical protein QWZ13_01885 [Reinekea marina]|uniref:hypothetical protein n=1 Tax=Reinekea marina TaxID=1310421 RepID=UPI0025B4DF1A|nr:hypothetical protein [Reinekea marina]MDN3647656.1 hypothetical protein [Reinekea marina]